MIRTINHRAPVLLIALAVGWELLALACGLLAHSGQGSVLYAAFERFFLLLAVVPTALAAALIVWRSVPRGDAGSAHFVAIALGAAGLAGLVGMTCWVATSFPDVRVGLVALAGTVAIMIRLDRPMTAGGGVAMGRYE